ncbi:hypothetical protein GCM10010872_32670 [Dyella flava]|nr:hypothetical protein GCM10010872_32670 [Dyella flava]
MFLQFGYTTTDGSQWNVQLATGGGKAARVYRREQDAHGFESVHGLSPMEGFLPNLPASGWVWKGLIFPSTHPAGHAKAVPAPAAGTSTFR